MRCTVDNPLAKARGLPLRTGAQPMLYLPLVAVAVLVVVVIAAAVAAVQVMVVVIVELRAS